MAGLVGFVPNEEELVDIFDKTRAFNKGQKIKAVRQALNMTQAELGEKVGVSAARIQQYEAGYRNAKTELCKKIALATGVEPATFVEPDLTNPFGAMYALFAMEERFGMDFVRDKDDNIYIQFGHPKFGDINGFIKEWAEKKRQTVIALEKAKSEEEQDQIYLDYYMWEWTFPQPFIDEPYRKKKQDYIEKELARLQDELVKLKAAGKTNDDDE